MVNFGLVLAGLLFAGLGVLVLRDPAFFAVMLVIMAF